MKNLFLLLVTFFFMIGSIRAQWSWGFEVGATGSIFQTTDEYKEVFDNKVQPGVALGFIANFPMGDDQRLRLQPGAYFVQKGGGFSFDKDLLFQSGITDIKIKQRLNYLQIPLKLQYRFSEAATGLSVSAGPYLGVGISGKANFSISPNNLKEVFSELIRSQYSNFPNGYSQDAFRTSNIEFGKDDGDNYTRLDMGIVGSVDYFITNVDKLRTWILSLQVGVGMKTLEGTNQKNIWGGPNNTLKNYWATDGTLKNLTLQLSAAYLIDHDPH